MALQREDTTQGSCRDVHCPFSARTLARARRVRHVLRQVRQCLPRAAQFCPVQHAESEDALATPTQWWNSFSSGTNGP